MLGPCPGWLLGCFVPILLRFLVSKICRKSHGDLYKCNMASGLVSMDWYRLHTVDGRNPTPPGSCQRNLEIMGYRTYQLVSRISAINSIILASTTLRKSHLHLGELVVFHQPKTLVQTPELWPLWEPANSASLLWMKPLGVDVFFQSEQ